MALFDNVLDDEQVFKRPILGSDTLFLKKTGEQTGLGKVLDVVLPTLGAAVGTAFGGSGEKGAQLMSQFNQGLQSTSARKFRTASDGILNEVQQSNLESMARSQIATTAAGAADVAVGVGRDLFGKVINLTSGLNIPGGGSQNPGTIPGVNVPGYNRITPAAPGVGNIDTPISDYDRAVQMMESADMSTYRFGSNG